VNYGYYCSLSIFLSLKYQETVAPEAGSREWGIGSRKVRVDGL
jgi:hypothetical protein